jgi:MFS transporter, YNFM family, putative membrane transport protein
MTTGSATISDATRRSILLLSFATFASMAVQRICDAMLPELAREFSVSLAQAAQVVSVFAVVYGLCQLFYGPLGDRLGKYRVVSIATLGCSVGSLLAVFSGSLNLLVFARVLVALGAAAIIPLSLAWIGDTVVYEQRQETLARVGLGTTLGIVGGQLLGGVFTDTLGWRWAFAFMTLLFGIVGALLWADWKRQLAAPKVEHSAQPVVRPGFAAQALTILTGKWSRIVLLVAFIEGAAGFGVMAIWASHLHRELGLSLAASGAIVALFGLGGMLYMAVARPLIRRLGERGLALLGVIVLLLSVGVLAFAPHWWPTLPASLLGGFGFFMFHNTMQANATQMSPTARGTAVSLFAAALFMGQSVGVLLAAALVERIGSGAVMALGGGVMFAVGVFFSQALRRRDALMHLE